MLPELYLQVQRLQNDLKAMIITAKDDLSKVNDVNKLLVAEFQKIHTGLSKELDVLAKSQPPNTHNIQLIDKEGCLDNDTKEILMSKLLKSHEELNELRDQIEYKNSNIYSIMEEIYEHDDEASLKLVDAEFVFKECYDFLISYKEKLTNLQKSVSWSQEKISSSRDALLPPVIFIISKQLFPQLKQYISGDMVDTMANMTEEFWNSLDEILGYVNVYQLGHILATEPQSDITIIMCSEQVRFAYWKLKKDHLHMLLGTNKWSKLMGTVMDQFSHEICWAIVSVELVSAVRHIERRDTKYTRYSAQALVDFTMPHLRSESRGNHFCYRCHVRDGLIYVSEKGIERAETRTLEKSCNKDVKPRNSSNLGYIGGVVTVQTLAETLGVLQRHPVSSSIPIFEPEYSYIKGKIYRGATSRISSYRIMHSVNLTGWGEEHGEKYFWARSSQGEDFGVEGYLKVSVEIMMMCLTTGKYDAFIEHQFPLLNEFVYPTLLSPEEEERRRREEDHRSHLVN